MRGIPELGVNSEFCIPNSVQGESYLNSVYAANPDPEIFEKGEDAGMLERSASTCTVVIQEE